MTKLKGATVVLQTAARRAGTWFNGELTVVRLNEQDSHFLATNKGMTLVRPETKETDGEFHRLAG